MSSRLSRAFCFVAYYGVARHLPWSPRPGGAASKKVRAACAKRMLDRCGAHPNVEHGAWFGSGRGIELGDRSDLGMDSLILGPVTIGSDVMMAPRCVLVAQSHRTVDLMVPMNRQGFDPVRRIVIEDDVWLGANVTVLPGRRIGRGSIVAAGAVVVRDVVPYSIVGGNPALVIGRRGSDPGTHEPLPPGGVS